MTRKFKVYAKGTDRAEEVLVTEDYAAACAKERELKDKGRDAFVWEV